MEPSKIVIVGASSGLGRLMAIRFASMGWTVGVAARNVKALNDLKELHPNNIEPQPIDICSPDAPSMLASLIARVGGMDVYLHVSGILAENPEIVPEEELRTVDTNVGGFTRMLDAAFNYFRNSQRKGMIAAITSVAGTKGIADLPAYSASKRYQWIYLQALEQLARRESLGISFSDIRPGWTKTPLIDPNRRYLMAMNPEKVANFAVKAIIKRKRVAYIDCRWAIASWFWRAVPSWVWTRIPLRASR